MKENPIINAYLDAEKQKEIDLINEADKNFSLWLAELEKDESRDVTMAYAVIKYENDMKRFKNIDNNDIDGKALNENCVRVENDMAKLFSLVPAERVKNAVNYYRQAASKDKANSIRYLESAFGNLYLEYRCKPDIVDGIIKFRVYLIKKWGLNSFSCTIGMIKDILDGHHPTFV